MEVPVQDWEAALIWASAEGTGWHWLSMSGWARLAEQTTCTFSQEVKQERKKRQGSHSPVQGHTPNDVSTSHRALFPQGSTTSHQHCPGNQAFNTWTFGKHSSKPQQCDESETKEFTSLCDMGFVAGRHSQGKNRKLKSLENCQRATVRDPEGSCPSAHISGFCLRLASFALRMWEKKNDQLENLPTTSKPF